MTKAPKLTAVDDPRFHPWPGWPDNVPYCTRCTFKPADDYDRLAERLIERMHLYAIGIHTAPHQIGEGWNNLVRMASNSLRSVGRTGIRAALKAATDTPPPEQSDA